LSRLPVNLRKFLRDELELHGQTSSATLAHRQRSQCGRNNPALEQIEIAPTGRDAYFGTFKLYRESFERIASKKYD
jgi:hypothetical protein